MKSEGACDSSSSVNSPDGPLIVIAWSWALFLDKRSEEYYHLRADQDTVRIETLSPELFAILETARGGAAHEEMVGVCRALGADEAQMARVEAVLSPLGPLVHCGPVGCGVTITSHPSDVTADAGEMAFGAGLGAIAGALEDARAETERCIEAASSASPAGL